MNDHHTAALAHYQGLVDQLAAADAALEKYRTEFAEVERLQALAGLKNKEQDDARRVLANQYIDKELSKRGLGEKDDEQRR